MRLFIGIALDDALRVQLRREAEALRAYMRGNFSLPANYHVTLAFLGQHEESEIPAIRAAIDAASARRQFDIGIGGLGSFQKGKGSTSMGTLWNWKHFPYIYRRHCRWSS